MSNYFTLTEDQKRAVITQTAHKIGLPVQAVEKDLWVTVFLQIVFSLPIAEYLIFKGGTSLSKVWNLIERFSEDIDLAIDRRYFGYEGDLTKKQIKVLRKKSSLFVRDELCKAIQDEVKKLGLDNYCIVESEPDGEGDNTYPEPRKIHIRYKSLFGENNAYLAQTILLEVGARSLIEPTEIRKVQSLITQSFPIESAIADANIITSVPAKTFLEKAFLLHELFSTGGGLIADRKSRHLYDLEKMMDQDFAQNAINDDELWNSIHHHREIFTAMKDVDYSPDIRERICLIPPENVIEHWKKDYETMQGSMIHGESLNFEELIQRISNLSQQFKAREPRENQQIV